MKKKVDQKLRVLQVLKKQGRIGVTNWGLISMCKMECPHKRVRELENFGIYCEQDRNGKWTRGDDGRTIYRLKNTKANYRNIARYEKQISKRSAKA